MEKDLEEFFIESATKEGMHYEPENESEAEYKRFLEIINNLKELEINDFVEILKIHKFNRTGKYDKILYRITSEGREWLSSKRILNTL